MLHSLYYQFSDKWLSCLERERANYGHLSNKLSQHSKTANQDRLSKTLLNQTRTARHSTEVAFTLLTQLPRIRFLAYLCRDKLSSTDLTEVIVPTHLEWSKGHWLVQSPKLVLQKIICRLRQLANVEFDKLSFRQIFRSQNCPQLKIDQFN